MLIINLINSKKQKNNRKRMYKSSPNQLKVQCSMNQPIQLLADKLASKSTDLYVFWQNYDHLYRQYNEKLHEIHKLKEEIEYMRKNYHNQPKQTQVKIQQDPYLKDRLKNTEQICQQLRTQLENNKTINRDQKTQIIRLVEQNNQMTILITQLREENSQQRMSIANILQKLKQAQNQINGYEKIYEQVQQKDMIINKLVEKEKEMQILLEDRDEQIQRMAKEFKDAKIKYERIIKESMQNAKETVMNSLPTNYKGRNTDY